MTHRVFVTGGTGYMGSRLIPVLLNRGHRVTALVREQSRSKLTAACDVVTGNPLEGDSYAAHVTGHDTLVHLVGVAHPGPSKAREFIDIDLRSGLEAVRVASRTGVGHFIYLSVAQPAPVMKTYIDVRASCESAIRQAGLNATVLRPWYVLGPGHRWPLALVPFYWLAEQFSGTREGALRLGLVTINQMIEALAVAVESAPAGMRIVGVPEIRGGFPARLQTSMV